MSSDSVRVKRLTNGYMICVTDPKIQKANDARDFSSKNTTPYRDPDREFVFKNIDAVLAWLKANLDTALPAGDVTSSFDSTFDAAVKDDDDGDE